MKSIILETFGSPDVFELREVDKPPSWSFEQAAALEPLMSESGGGKWAGFGRNEARRIWLFSGRLLRRARSLRR
jgi:hypothetical protein